MRIIPWMNTNEKKKIAILGSTGSIGTQALQVIEEHSDLYEAYVLTANNRVELLIEQARRFMPEAVVIANEDKYEVRWPTCPLKCMPGRMRFARLCRKDRWTWC